jgi:hypothetical protein
VWPECFLRNKSRGLATSGLARSWCAENGMGGLPAGRRHTGSATGACSAGRCAARASVEQPAGANALYELRGLRRV